MLPFVLFGFEGLRTDRERGTADQARESWFDGNRGIAACRREFTRTDPNINLKEMRLHREHRVRRGGRDVG